MSMNKESTTCPRLPTIEARFMLEGAVCDTERGDTEPGTAFVFTLYRASCGRARRVHTLCVTQYLFML